jgi:two-component system response regulator VanR
VELYLKNDNYQVLKFYNGTDALACIEKERIDLAILDIMMPDISGLEVLKQIRKNYTFPVIMLTAKTGSMDKINGLTMGADDYIEKPFQPLELMARVKAQLRRVTKYNEGARENKSEIIEIGGLVLNKNTHQCLYNEKEISLTPIEFSILWLLSNNRGQVISSEKLFEEVWKEKYYKNNNNTVMVHIRHLREKLFQIMGHRDLIKTVWGVGYKIDD